MRVRLLAVALIVGAGSAASAQVLGLPVVNSGVPLGIAFAADVGFSNRDAGDGTALGAHAEFGLGIIGVRASVSRYTPKFDNAVTSPGASVTLKLFGGPLIPFRVMLQAGASHWEVKEVATVPGGGESTTTFKTTRVPVSIGFAATIPVPAFAIKPWIAPRIDVTRTSFGFESGTATRFGISGGIEVAFLNGFSARAAYDRIIDGDSTPAIFSIGVGFAP